MTIEHTENGYILTGTRAELQRLITMIEAICGVRALTRRESMGELTVICEE